MARTEIAYSLNGKRRVIRLDNHPDGLFLVQCKVQTKWEVLSRGTPFLASAIEQLEGV